MPTEPPPPHIRDSTGTETRGSVRHADSRCLPDLGGRAVTFIRIDHQTRLQVDEFEIVIETPFTLRTPQGEFHLDPAQRRGLGPLLGCYPATLMLATMDPDAALHLEFDGGAVLDVPPDEHFEAWQVNGPETFLIVCLPGRGQLAVWT